MAGYSKADAERIVAWIGRDEERFAELIKLFIGPTYRISQRAARPVSICIERNPELIRPHWNTFVKQLEAEDIPVAVRRNVARALQYVEIPKRYQGRVFEACYGLLDDPVQPVAVRVFSMTVAANIARGNENLMRELRLVAEKYPQAATTGFRSRANRVLGLNMPCPATSASDLDRA